MLLDDDEKSYLSRTELGLKPGRAMVIVNEPGLYGLNLRILAPWILSLVRNLCNNIFVTLPIPNHRSEVSDKNLYMFYKGICEQFCFVPQADQSRFVKVCLMNPSFNQLNTDKLLSKKF